MFLPFYIKKHITMQYLLTICEYGTKAIDTKLIFLQVYFVGIVIFRTFAFDLTTSHSKRDDTSL